ncbi:hypothetical protein [Novosphingobium sp. 9U]|uniref:hypothetical protein n=1 Tax=Novosphingobium sp. 9U TaxID=2653158 RepID=UPI0012F0478B|nr:hypothetical protein [Novosphingobium sp. 9U]VWX50150.1 conserved membrane hypothetical protein [Novosphingobium sp. 9U]
MGASPPVDMMVNSAAEHWALVVMAALWCAALIFALVHWRRSGRPIVLLMFLAGGGMMLMEPMVDTVAGCWFPRDSVIFYSGWGRPIPLWVCLTYFVYFGLGAGTAWHMMTRGLGYGALMAFYGGEIVADTVLEVVLLNAGTYTYYGHQPLLIASFPFWWATVNSLVSLAAAGMTYLLAPRLAGAALLLLVPALLCTSAAVNAAAGWPAWFAINSNLGMVGTQVAGLVTCTFALTLAHLIASYISRDHARATSFGMRPNFAGVA